MPDGAPACLRCARAPVVVTGFRIVGGGGEYRLAIQCTSVTCRALWVLDRTYRLHDGAA